MDKGAIKSFAIAARELLRQSAKKEAGFYGITEDEIRNPIQKGNDFEVYETIAGTENRIYGNDIKRRANLVNAINTLGFEQVIEETAYTWFNRLIAIRFMEVNDYLPTRVRVLSSETGSNTPDIVSQSLDVDLNMTPEEIEKVQVAKEENRYDEAFRLLFIKQCNELNAILPGLFEKTDDYMELLLKITYTNDGVVRMLVDNIPEDNFNIDTEGQVEIIGWLYQYYNTELKDDTFAKLKTNMKISKDRIPAATQLFTPDWIVRYMVENSVGRVWIEHLRTKMPGLDEKVKAEEFGWKYYLPEAEHEIDVEPKWVEIRNTYKDLTPSEITCIDPCMGSGHILVYMFDVLMDIYRSEGFNERDAVFSILENNIRGLDIDRRAYQLSYFALMMKGRQYNRRFFRGIETEEGERRVVGPHIFAIEESNDINREQLKYFGATLNEVEKNDAINQMIGLLNSLIDAKEYGSILEIGKYNWSLLRKFASKVNIDGQISLDTLNIGITKKQIYRLIDIGEVMANKYFVVVTNPPYIDPSSLIDKIHIYVKKQYPYSKSDMCSIFTEKSLRMIRDGGYASLVTMQSWMFLSSYEKFRSQVLKKFSIKSILHLGMEAFEGIVGKVVTTAAFVINNSLNNERNITAIRLVDFFDSRRYLKEEQYFNLDNRFSVISQNDIMKIPGQPLAYWIDRKWIDIFNNNQTLGENAKVKRTLQTGDSNRFMRIWFEVNKDKTQFKYVSRKEALESNAKWFMFSYGGRYRKWYGNLELVVNWENNGFEIKATGKSIIPSEDLYFKETLAWSKVTSNDISVRYYEQGILPGDASACIFDCKHNSKVLLGYLNSCVARELLRMISPSMNFPTGTVAQLPIPVECKEEERIIKLVEENIDLSKEEWNAYETAWDFEIHPLIKYKQDTLEQSYLMWKERKEQIINQIKQNEKCLDEYFIEEMQVNNNIISGIEHGSEAIKVDTPKEAIISLIMYAVGCMFGRYSIVEPGLICTSTNVNFERYGKYLPVSDNIIPISDKNYFNNDICSKFIDFLSITFGEQKLQENMKYLCSVLRNDKDVPEDVLREYFLNDFYKDHLNMYSNKNLGKRPIYWMFDSGKENGFKVLIYMHRYNRDTVGVIRSDYLHKVQDALENELKNSEYIISTSSSAVDKAKATKERDKYIKQLNEIRTYYQALSHVALQRIEIDPDDGVKHNYALFQGVEVSNEGMKKQTIDLLAKLK